MIRTPEAICPSKAPLRARRRGLGLVEILLCLSISSMLLTGVAFAFRASFNSFKDAQQRGQFVNAARSGLYQITADIRSADSLLPYDPNATVSAAEVNQFKSNVVAGNPNPGLASAGGSGVIGIQLYKSHPDSRDPTASAANPVTITYWLDTATQNVYVTRATLASTTTPQVICKFVQSLQIYIQPQLAPHATLPIGRRVVVTMTLGNFDANGDRLIVDGGQDLILSFTDSAIPRKAFPGL